MTYSNFSSAVVLTLYVAMLLPIVHPSNTTFCSSICAGSIGACFGPAPNQCWACSASIYYLQRNDSGVCAFKPQHSAAFFELKNDAMDLTGYHSTKLTPQICDQYSLSGQYIQGDYLQKIFTGLPLNHYQVVVRFGVGYIGNWSPEDTMLLQLDDQSFSWKHNFCDDAQDLCSSSGADCFKIVEKVITHSSQTLSVYFSSLINSTDPNVQYWGIKDLMIALRTCNSRCETCFGPGSADCTTCAPGFLLLGNMCVSECSYFALQSKRICVEECPIGHFGDLTTRQCETCMTDCMVCSSKTNCSVWNPDKKGWIWGQNKMFWILLIVIGFLIFLYLLWKLVIKRRINKKVCDNEHLQKSIMSSENNIDDVVKPQNEKTEDNINVEEQIIEPKLEFEEKGEIPWSFEVGNGNFAVPNKKRKKMRTKEMPELAISTFQLDVPDENLKL